MAKFPWKTTLAGAALLAATTYAFAQMTSGGPGMHSQMQTDGMHQMHDQMMRDHGGMHRGLQPGGRDMSRHSGMHGRQAAATSTPTMPGQDAFGAIQEVVQMLQSDPQTDWSNVNIDALREHLIDMNEVTLHAAAIQRVLDNGIEIAVTGEGRTVQAIRRMVPAHVNELREIGWNAISEELPNGVKLIVTASETQPLMKLKALGFMGIMVQGSHHQRHHLVMAQGGMQGH